MTAYKFRIDTGYAGTLSREPAPGDITPESLDPAANWSAYGFGLPVKYNGSGQITPLTGGETASQIAGLLVRSYPGRAVTNTGRTAYPQINGGAQDTARRGFMSVVLNGAGTPVKGSPVYVRVANAGTGEFIGGFEATVDATAGNQIELPNARFEGPAGSDGITEISFNLQ